jgi:hypothetical protein
MIRSAAVVLALALASSAQGMPHAPLQQPEDLVIPVRQGCGLGRQLLDGVCVRNSSVRAAVRRCNARRMRLVNGRCEPRAKTVTAPSATRPSAQSPAAASAPPR